MNKRVLGILIGLLAIGVAASASPVSCNGTTTTNVTTLGTLVCAGSGESFSNFTVTSTGSATVGLSAMTFDAATGIVVIQFNPFPVTVPQDITLGYLITGPTNGIDFNVLGTPLSGITFSEIACSTQLCAGQNNVVFANISNAGPVQVNSASFATQTSVWIKKDINFNSGTSVLTDFTDSSHVPVPEPMTLSMMGIGALGAEGASAAAGGLHIRVIELEPGAFQALDVIHFRAVQIQQARLVDEHLQAAKAVGLIQHSGTVLESHRVAEA
jgi:hypothetical protein